MEKQTHGKSSVVVLVTGGTFDKEYDEINGKLYFKDTHLSEMLSLGRSSLEVEVKPLMMIDSLEMTSEHRTKILNACASSNENKIVITHGTDTMTETAKILGSERERLKGKTIVLTGAMIPYKFGSSDGLFNLGAALAFAQSLPSGVFIAMNGRYFNWNNVRKNKSTGLFECLE